MEWDLGGISQRSASQLQEMLHGSSPTYAEVVDFRSRAWSLCEMRRGENWNWAPRISYTHRQLQIRSGPIQHSLWAAGLHRNRGMSRRIGRASFACCRARRVDKLTTISMCVVVVSPGRDLFTLARDDGKCAFWGPTSLNCCRSCRCDRCRRRRLIGSTCRLNFYTIVFLFSFHFLLYTIRSCFFEFLYHVRGEPRHRRWCLSTGPGSTNCHRKVSRCEREDRNKISNIYTYIYVYL